jgi:hypothetical protein
MREAHTTMITTDNKLKLSNAIIKLVIKQEKE